MKLYIVPTPIGNLQDITLRALEVLRGVDFILAEDTRQTSKLLKHYQLHKTLYPYHKFNEHKSSVSIIQKLKAGASGALVSDGGTPCISDPGLKLVQLCISEGISVETLPGATALIPALINSGFDIGEFHFMGFLPHKKGRQTALRRIAEMPYTVILYESPHRILKLLQELSQHIGDTRTLSVSREISKVYEETVRDTANNLLQYFSKNTPKGEFVVVIGPLKHPQDA
ncbi:MAG: 16S rRNA (cytidine(1402)-2'-O)-methyltransferase [Chitinophagales bacterium]|nr:16S rRNA (cytidine(1402)-2'-O)-methyltransferase [Chitinophagales bacterium]MDW8418333.1 16S rRNA (cytidine(1402)-2'-O)-methyltransferase [Chitinophagales bacterium]